MKCMNCSQDTIIVYTMKNQSGCFAVCFDCSDAKREAITSGMLVNA